jgi:hypothetical protein
VREGYTATLCKEVNRGSAQPLSRGDVLLAADLGRREVQVIKLGYKLMSEEHGPADLVRNAKRDEEAGFDFAADHYFPWLEEQGHVETAARARAARSEQATKANATTRAVIAEIQRAGKSTLAAIAQELEARGVRTPAGRDRWAPAQGSRLLAD